ncbi:MAG: hypothetical protein M0T74_03815 [Desulfitobacterium hafniense]|nr:hypothetical protein [Desulfitobacterium hafniense]
MVQRQKVNEVMIGIGLLMMSVLVFIFTLSLALIPPKGGTAISPLLGEYHINSLSMESPIANALLWLFIPMISLITYKAGMWRLRDGIKIRQSALNYKPQTVWSKIATFMQFKDILNTGLFMLLFLALLVLCLHEFWYSPKAITPNIFFFTSGFLIYILSRKILDRNFASFTKKALRGMPTYTLTEDGLTIKLVTMWNKKHPDPPPVHIFFDEIEDLQVLTFVEADAFLKYNIGPDLNIGMQQAKDFTQYIRGDIRRPSVYAFGGSGGTNNMRVMIRGPELFYMITFDTDDVSDLVEAYRLNKETRVSNS